MALRFTTAALLAAALHTGAVYATEGTAQAEPSASPTANTAEAAPAAETVEVVVGLRWRNEPELEQFLREVANPQSPAFNQFLTSAEFDRRFGPSAESVEAAVALLRRRGLTVTEVSPSRLFITAVGSAAAVRQAEAFELALGMSAAETSPAALDAATAPAVDLLSVQGAHEEILFHPPHRGPLLPPQVGAVFLPVDIARIYQFEPLYETGIRGEDARHSTIAIATAFGFSTADLERFWQSLGIPRSADSVELIPVGGEVTTTGDETTLDVEWASAMAPGSRILVYAAASASSSSFLKIYDRIVTENRAAVLTTSWGVCERRMPGSHLNQAHAIFQRAAAQGITVLAASGDAGAYDCGPDAPGVSFPASNPYVLAVGGTTVREDEATVSEVAWEGSGGGTSAKWPAPPWQMQPQTNRVLADVALNADPATPYMVAYDNSWWYFGGTSVAAPIWAALIALTNQYRAHMGRAPLGLAAPALCEVAHARGLAARPLRDVTSGDNQGFAAGRGWDFPTGWGSPRADDLARTLGTWSPPADARGGRSEVVMLTPTGRDIAGAVRVRFTRRCLSTEVSVRARRLPPGRYTFGLDGEPVASLEVGPGGRVTARLLALDPHGHLLALSDESRRVLFAGSFAADAAPVVVRVEMIRTLASEAASGVVVYQAARGREVLSVYASDLPAGEYEVRLGRERIGTLRSRGPGTSALVRFDSSGAPGNFLPTRPLCQSVSIARGALPYLRSPARALAITPCGS